MPKITELVKLEAIEDGADSGFRLTIQHGSICGLLVIAYNSEAEAVQGLADCLTRWAERPPQPTLADLAQ